MSILDSLAGERSFEEFAYQVLYMRPSLHLEERIAVGLLAESASRIEARFISSISAIETMVQLFGEAGVEQFQFAAGEIRRAIHGVSRLSDLTLPTDLFVAGEQLVAFTADRSGLLINLLASSCLVGGSSEKRIQVAGSRIGQFSKQLIEEVARLNPLVAHQIFNRRVRVEDDELKIPIFGNRIFGAPVSFADRDQTTQTESYVAKFRWLRGCVGREPRIYVLRPRDDRRVDGYSRLKQLADIAKASDVPLRIGESPQEVAAQIIHDEAA